jgi:protein AroM
VASQVTAAQDKWAADGFQVKVTYAAPFRDAEIQQAAITMAEPALELVVLDCMGHNPTYHKEFARLCGRPVLLAQSLVARIAGELIGP